ISIPSTDLSIVQLASRSLSQVTGTLYGNINIAGTPTAPVFSTGDDDVKCISALVGCSSGVQIQNGSARLTQLGVVLNEISCNVWGAGDWAGGDSIRVSNCHATSPPVQRGGERGTIAVDGWVKNFARFLLAKPDPLKPAPVPSFRLAVTLGQFHA